MKRTTSLTVALALAAALAVAVPAASARIDGQWVRQSPVPTALNLNGVAFASPGHGFIVGESSLLMETSDGGASWQPRPDVDAGGDPLYEVDFFGQNGWITSNNRGFRTTDGGATWKPMVLPGGSWYHIDFISPSEGWLGANGAIVHTTDGGATWQLLIGYPDSPIVYGMDFRDTRIGLVAGNHTQLGDGTFKSADGGKSWRKTFSGYVNDVAWLAGDVAIAAGNDRLYRSGDAGESWTQTTPIDTEDGYASVARVTDTIAVATSQRGDVWRSTDGGRSWAKVFAGIGSYPYLWEVSFVTEQDGWIAGENGVVASTADGGLTWQIRSNGIGEHFNDIEMRSSSFGLAVGEDGYVLRTTDGGDKWSVTRLKVTGDQFLRDENLRGIQFLDDGFAVTGGYGGIAFKTLDGGQSWTSIGYPRLPALFRIFDITFTGQSVGWVVGADDDLGHDRTVYFTTNGGATWTRKPVDPANFYSGVEFADPQHGWIVGPRTFMLRTDDAGATWQRVSIPGDETNLFMFDVEFADAQTGWVVGTLGYAVRSTDGGRTWTRQNTGTEEALRAIDVVSPTEAWVSTLSGSVLHTTNGGTTWTREQAGANESLWGIAAAGGRVWVAGDNGTILVSGAEQQAELASVTVTPATVDGGRCASGEVTLTAPAPDGGALVTLESSDPAVVTLPASVTVPAGTSSAGFTVETAPVDGPKSVTISGFYGVTRTAQLTVARTPLPDTVTIQKAVYRRSTDRLRVSATSSVATAALEVAVVSSGDVIGMLPSLGCGSYSGTFTWPVNPVKIRVSSDFGGSATRRVTVR